MAFETLLVVPWLSHREIFSDSESVPRTVVLDSPRAPRCFFFGEEGTFGVVVVCLDSESLLLAIRMWLGSESVADEVLLIRT